MATVDLTSGLNDEQAKAVLSESERILMLAGAGTGKTRTLTRRLAHLNLNCRVGTSSIIAITFTRAAAKEMKERLKPLIGESETKKLVCCTFHALAVRILQEWSQRLGLDKHFTIYSQEDREEIIKAILTKFGFKTTFSKILDKRDKVFMSEEASAWNEYQWQLKRFNAVDIDNLIPKVVDLFRNHADVSEYYRKMWKHVYVDEMQDTSNDQLLFLQLHNPHNLFVVGDDYQTIYSFTGARVKNILEFPQEFPGTETIKLEHNYRSTRQIVEAANNLISHNVFQTEKTLISTLEGPEVEILSVQDQDIEMDILVRGILQKDPKEKYSDYAVLARTNALVEEARNFLRSKGIPCMVISNSDDPLKQPDVKNLLSYLDWIFNPKDEFAFKKVLRFPEMHLSELQIQEAEEVAIRNSEPLWHALIRSDDPKVYQYGSDLHSIAEDVRGCYFATDAFQMLIRKLKLDDHYEERLLLNRKEDISKALTYILYWTERQEKAGEDYSPSAFLKWVKIRDIQEKFMEERDAVKLMTVHGSKGLEFENVYLIGMNEGIFPSRNTRDMEEERRLAFVAVTRAKRFLTITSSKMTRNWGKTEEMAPSRFIAELKSKGNELK
ncbi:ATP-dependent helicase [Paenibacillus sp. 2RAB27]|uniref:ATP-dependent helicase n=1 Tax=Paenibacillus sp. 2RAB27 TaxID=3232991 RepID=UPI003F96E6DF